MDYINQANVGGTSYILGLPNVYINDKGNLNIETSAEIGNTPANKGKINVEANSDIQFKPGDDVIFYSHHRAEGKQDEVAIKMTDGDDNPVKAQINTSEINLTTKLKNGSDGGDLNVAVNCNTNTRGYLKVRAQAIDLRCEKHGGVALQPKGYDSEGNMNKIKFEHGGGDGLEFGTFNTEKTSIFTDEYRFNKDGVWKMATRQTEASGKTIKDEGTVPAGKVATGSLKYVKQADDFYDIIAQDDEQCTTKDIIKTAYALNGGKDRHAKITNKGAIEISTNITYVVNLLESTAETTVSIATISDKIAALASVTDGQAFNDGDFVVGSGNPAPPINNATVYTNTAGQLFTFSMVQAPGIKIESGGELKLGGILDFGSSFNFGETDNGIEVQYKLTKKNATKDCGIIKVVGYNNSTTQALTVEGVTVPAKSNADDTANTATIASCSILDMIKLVNYMKTNNQGPWASQA